MTKKNYGTIDKIAFNNSQDVQPSKLKISTNMGRSIYNLISSKLFRACGTIVYVVGLIFALSLMILIWPKSVATLSWIIILGALAMIILPIIRRNNQLYKLGKYSQSVFIRKTGVDVISILFTGVIAIVLAGASARFIGTLAGNAVEKSIPGLGTLVGILVGLLTGVLVGLGVTVLIQRIINFLNGLGSSRQSIQ